MATSARRPRSAARIAEPSAGEDGSHTPWWRGVGLDVVVLVALVVVGLVLRARVQPSDGLIFDDAWVAIGAAKAPLRDLAAVSESQLGFVLAIRVWARLGADSAAWMAMPAWIVGSATGALLYGALRLWRVQRVVALLVAIVLMIVPEHVQYSGRVKPYVVDTVVVVLLAAVLPWLARRRWTWWTVAAWVVASVLFGTFTLFSLGILGVAGLVLVANPRGDLPRRVVALVAQGALSLAYAWWAMSLFDSAQVGKSWERVYDAYIEPTVHPGRMLSQLATHVGRVGTTFVDLGTIVGIIVVLVPCIALGLESRRGPRRVQSQFLLALPLVALVASMLGLVPFGPKFGGSPVYPGGRATLWLLPSLAVGWAFALDRTTRALLARAPRLRTAAVVVAGVLLLLVAWPSEPAAYPDPGSESVARFVARRAGTHDVVVVFGNAAWTYAFPSEVPVHIRTDASSYVGYAAEFADRRVLPPRRDSTISLSEVRTRAARARRMFVVNGYVGVFDQEPAIASVLTAAGWHREASLRRGVFRVTEWARSPGAG